MPASAIGSIEFGDRPRYEWRYLSLNNRRRRTKRGKRTKTRWVLEVGELGFIRVESRAIAQRRASSVRLFREDPPWKIRSIRVSTTNYLVVGVCTDIYILAIDVLPHLYYFLHYFSLVVFVLAAVIHGNKAVSCGG